jgi:hypothetical protein
MSASFVRESQTLFGLTITDNGMSAVNVSRTERQTQKQRRKRMKSSAIVYECALNNGSASLITDDKEYFELRIAGYQGEPELSFLSKGELIELGEWLISMGKGKE